MEFGGNINRNYTLCLKVTDIWIQINACATYDRQLLLYAIQIHQHKSHYNIALDADGVEENGW